MQRWKDSLAYSNAISFKVAVILAVLIVLIRLALFAFIKDRETLLSMDDLLFAIASGLSVFGMLFAAFHSKGQLRNAWFILAIALIANIFGDASWAVAEAFLHQNSIPSVADVGYFMFYPIFALGILLLPEAPLSTREGIKILLDAGILVLAYALVFWTFIIGPLVASSKEVTLGFMVSVAYPIMDMILFISLMELIFRKLSSTGPAPMFLLAFGIVAVLIADMIFCIQLQQGAYVSHNILSIGWFISYMLFWLAGILQSSPLNQSASLNVIRSRNASWTQYLPFIGIGVAYALIIWDYQNLRFISHPILAGFLGIVVGMMFIRQKITLDERNQLLETALLESEERKRAEDMLKASLVEKELLLKEIHHRVKNNLQVISTLLYLQSLNFTDENVQKIFKDSQDRIKSIALIHENFYKSESLGKVDFDEYLRQLISHLSESHSGLIGKIRFNVHSDGVFLNIDTAISCGMIISELVSNSFKYAFPGGRSGEIRIDLSTEGDEFILIVSDNGVGIAGDLNIKDSKTLGLQLVDTLVKQIDGKMSLDTKNGARYEIHFRERRNEGKK